MNQTNARTITIFISSPGDLSEERYALATFLKQLNKDPAYQGHYHFDPKLYETDAPEIAGMDWQQIINLYMLHPSKATLVIGMLWKRLGTPLTNFTNPITGRNFRSGTEYELYTAHDANVSQGLPQLLFYQCNRTIAKPQDEETKSQLANAQAFLQELQDEQILTPPISTFSSAQELCQHVKRDQDHLLPDIIRKLTEGNHPDFLTLPALPFDFVL